MQIATASCCMLDSRTADSQEGVREREREDQAKPKYKCAARDLIYALQDMTKHSAAARHNINSAFIPALSTLRFVLLRVVSLCNSVCLCVCVWSTFLAQVISAHFMLKSEKPSSASGSERRLGGTHMFPFAAFWSTERRLLCCCCSYAAHLSGRKGHGIEGGSELPTARPE